MKQVFVIGIGQTPVLRNSGQSPAQVGAAAVRAAIADAAIEPAQLDAVYVGNMTSGILSQQLQLAALVTEQSGLSNLEAFTSEAACASGAAAMRTGYMAIASGIHRAVVVCGTEQLGSADKRVATQALATAADREIEGSRGATFVSLNATLMRLYMERFALPPDALSGFSITAHRNATGNSNALFNKQITADDYRASRVVHEPLRLYDISPICDGAAAVVLADRQVAEGIVRNAARIEVAASTAATMPLALENRSDPLDLVSIRHATQKALQQAGISLDRIDLAELHDAYTIMTALSLEACGYAPAGQGWQLAAECRTGLHGDLPIATFGGLKARGHPVGATGVYQIVEACLQLRGDADRNQVSDAQFALTQNVGGTASTVINHILQRSG